MPSNIDAVKRSVRDVRSDIRDNIIDEMLSVLREIEKRIKFYISLDPHYKGDLKRSIRREFNTTTDANMEFVVYSHGGVAPYNAIVEFGSGKRTNKSWLAQPTPTPDEQPTDFPFDAPDIPKSGAKFNAFIGYIAEWMNEKGVVPQLGSLMASATAISRAIIDHGNYAHPYMRPAIRDKRKAVPEHAKKALRKATR